MSAKFFVSSVSGRAQTIGVLIIRIVVSWCLRRLMSVPKAPAAGLVFDDEDWMFQSFSTWSVSSAKILCFFAQNTFENTPSPGYTLLHVDTRVGFQTVRNSLGQNIEIKPVFNDLLWSKRVRNLLQELNNIFIIDFNIHT